MMRMARNRWWISGVLGIALPAASLMPQTVVAQEKATSDAPVVILPSIEAEDAFENYVSLEQLGVAWRNMDSVALTDSAMLFVEAERVLRRSHGSVKASDVIDMAIRVASEKGDKVSLGRLAMVLESGGDKERTAQVKLAIQAAGASRSENPVLKQGDTDTIQAVQAEILSAQVAGNKDQLKAIGDSLKNLNLTGEQRTALQAKVTEASEAVGEDSAVPDIVLELDRLGNVPRSFTEVKGPIGGSFVLPKFEDKEPLASDFDELTKQYASQQLTLTAFDDPSAALAFPTRGNQTNVVSGARGMATIWQWVNNDGYKTGSNCGTAAAATLLTRYDRKNRFQPYATPYNAVQKLEREGLGPDVIGGAWGTSRNRMQDIANRYGFNYAWGTKDQLEGCVAAGYPVAVMLDIANDKAGYPNVYNQWGFHWVVVYAVDGNNFYVTNWPTAKGAILKKWFYKGWEENAVAKAMLINSRFFYISPK